MVLILRKQPIFHFFWMTTPPLTPTLRRYLFNPRKGYHSRGDGLLPFFLTLGKIPFKALRGTFYEIGIIPLSIPSCGPI